jgi:hypothetical protein
MQKLIPVMVLGLLVVPAAAAISTPHVAGDWQGWDPSSNPMTQIMPGFWTASFNGLAANQRHEFKITDGSWGNSVPGSNSWLTTDGAGNVTIAYDANTHNDGWFPATDRLGLSTDTGAWTAVGDWQGWDNANPATAMTPVFGGLYTLTVVLPPGDYEWKAVRTGTWDAIGLDGRSINADNMAFSTDAVYDTVTFSLNAYFGTIRVQVVPEPSSLLLMGLGLLVLRRRRA